MKKVMTWALMLLMLFSFTSCKKDKEDDKDNDGDQTQVTEDLTVEGFTVDASKKVYLTSIGQSDLDTVQNILINAGKDDVEVVAVLQANAVEEGSVVIMVTGSSTKGLGSAGTDIGAENARAAAFALAAKENKFQLIVLHVGGTARRGEQADPIINTVVPEADLVMVVSEGNKDGKFTQLTAADAKFYTYSRAAKMVASFKAIFGL